MGKVRSSKGGFRAGSGRNPLFKEPLVSISLSMRAEDRKLLEKISKSNGGSLSNSVRLVIESYRTQNAPKKVKAAPAVKDGDVVLGTVQVGKGTPSNV